MKLTTRYILAEIAWPCALAFTVVVFLGVANEVRERLGFLDPDFIRLSDFAWLAIFFAPTLFTYIIPITFMLGILLAFGGLAQHNEITAMRAAGIPLRRLVLPVVAAGLVLSAVSFVLQDRVQPWATKQAFNLIFRELYVRATLDVLPPGKMHTFHDSGWRIYFREKDPEHGELRDIDILVTHPDGGLQMFHADAARIQRTDGDFSIALENVHLIQPTDTGYAFFYFPEREFHGPGILPPTMRPPRTTMTLQELLSEERDLSQRHGEARNELINSMIRGLRIEIASRFALPLASFAVCFCAAPLAVRSRAGGGRSYSFFIGIAIAAVFYVTLMAAEPRSLKPLWEFIVRGQAPNIVLLIAGGWFLVRVDRL